MNSLFWLSYAMLWTVALSAVAVSYVMLRQVGLLHERLGPAGAVLPAEGPEIGATIEPARLQAADGSQLRSPALEGYTLVVLSSTTCDSCERLAPAVGVLMRSRIPEIGVQELLVDVADADVALGEYVRRHQLEPDRVGAAGGVGERFSASITPLALILNREGKVLAKGVPNTLEQLELLIEEFTRRVLVPEQPEVQAPSMLAVTTHNGSTGTPNVL